MVASIAIEMGDPFPGINAISGDNLENPSCDENGSKIRSRSGTVTLFLIGVCIFFPSAIQKTEAASSSLIVMCFFHYVLLPLPIVPCQLAHISSCSLLIPIISAISYIYYHPLFLSVFIMHVLSGSISTVKKALTPFVQKDGRKNEALDLENPSSPCTSSRNCCFGGTDKEQFGEKDNNKSIQTINEYYLSQKQVQKKEFDTKKSKCSQSCWPLNNCSFEFCYSYCCCCTKIFKLSWPKLIVLGIIVTIFLITAEFSLDTSFCYFNPVVPLTLIPLLDPIGTGNHTITPADKQKTKYSITILGDSMILDAYEKYNLIGKIKQLLPSYNFNMTVHANNAVRIKNVRERFQRTLARESYLDGVIIMTDSDVTDVTHGAYSQQKQYQLLNNYTQNLQFVVQTIMKTKRYVAVASPCGVLLESPYFGPPTSSRFHDKETSLNLYTEATSKVAETLNIPYIDIRTPFLNAIPQYRLAYKGCVTRDGEHANEYGTIIIAYKFAEIINQWLYSSVSKAKY